jgi:hypothetical protein
MSKKLPFKEYQLIEQYLQALPDYFRHIAEKTIETPTDSMTVHHFQICHKSVSESERLPVLFIVAGVHGLEAIGIDILMSFVHHLYSQLHWNRNLQEEFKKVKIHFIPILNPHGYLYNQRSNFRGVDLMRNSPTESDTPWPFVGGQRFSNRLPYFRGNYGFEPENQFLLQELSRVTSTSPMCLSLDLHSGFGAQDFLWTPYAKSKGFPPQWARFERIKSLIDSTLPNHVYTIEPQSNQYTTSGDLWDFVFDSMIETGQIERNLLLPFTLEVGSWVWIKKSPFKAFRLKNLFNPAHSHRHKRVLRRHLPLLNLLLQLTSQGMDLFKDEKEEWPLAG